MSHCVGPFIQLTSKVNSHGTNANKSHENGVFVKTDETIQTEELLERDVIFAQSTKMISKTECLYYIKSYVIVIVNNTICSKKLFVGCT